MTLKVLGYNFSLLCVQHVRRSPEYGIQPSTHSYSFLQLASVKT